MRASIPTHVVDNSYENFPEGFYNGTISGAEVRDPNKDGSWLTLKLSLSDVTPKEGTDDPGRSAFSGDITLRTDGVDLTEDEYSSEWPFPVRKSAGLLAGLAEALGVANRDGGSVDVDLKAVTEALVNGEFAGEAVGFEVSHWTNNKDVTRDQFNRFGPAS